MLRDFLLGYVYTENLISDYIGPAEDPYTFFLENPLVTRKDFDFRIGDVADSLG